MAYDIWNDPDLWGDKKNPPPKQQDDGTQLDPITHFLSVVGERALRALPDTAGAIGDAFNSLPTLQPLDTLDPHKTVGSVSPDVAIPGMGKASKAVNKSYDAAEASRGPVPKAHNTAEKYAGAAAEMAANTLLGGGPEHSGGAVASGISSGVAGQAADDLFPDNPTAHILAMLAGGLSPAALKAAVTRAPEALAARAGISTDDLHGLIQHIEGGGTLDHPLTSPAGAKGPMQVMDATARAPGHGITPWDGKTEADRARVGTQLADALDQKYGGDVDKTLAAYNAGDGLVDHLISKFGDNWKDHLPTETKKYLANAREYEKGGLETPAETPTDAPAGASNNDELLAALEQQVAPKDNVVDLGKLTEPGVESEGASRLAATQQYINPTEENVISLKQVNPDWIAEKQSQRARSFADITPEEMERVLKENPEFVQQPFYDHLTPAERQEMDASAPKPVVDNTGYEAHTPYVDEPSTPANDVNPLERDPNPPAASSITGKTGRNASVRETPRRAEEGHEDAPSPHSDEHLMDKLANEIKVAKPVRSQQESMYTAARSKKLEQSVNAAAMNSGRSGFFAEKSALGGKLPKVDFEGVGKAFSPEEIDRLHDIIKENPRLTQFDKIHARDGLEKLLGLDDGGASVPTHSELRLLGETFPDNVMNSILSKRPFDQKFKDFVLGASSLTRALRASGDLSAPLRQGLNLIGTKAYWKAFGTMFKAAKSKDAFEAVQNEIASRNTYPLMRKAGLALTNVGRMLDDREEMFLSKLAEKAPWVKHSEYAYTAFLNKLRADTFDSLLKDAYAAGTDLRESPKTLKDMATYVNNATGRGDLGALSSGYKIWNAALFSPRLIMSRLRMLNPVFYIKLDPLVRQRALKDWAKLGGIALTTVTLAKMGGASVETDPRSSDFGKMKVGNTRFDPYGGYQQYLHLGVVLASGQSKSLMTGAVSDLNTGKFGSKTRVDSLISFARNKESPMANVIDDLFSAPNDRFGQKITPTKEVVNLFVPMVEEDIRQAFQDNTTAGAAAVPAAIFGSGVQTFTPKEKASKTPKNYDPFTDPALFSTGSTSKKNYDPFNDPALWGKNQ